MTAMRGLTDEEKMHVRVVEAYVDRNLRVCLEEPTTAIGALVFAGVSGKALAYAQALIHAPIDVKGE